MSGRLLCSARSPGPSYLDGELPLGEVGLALLGLLQNPRRVLRRQATADGAGLLDPEVKGQVLLVLVEEAELGTLLRVDDGKDAGDRLADIVAIRKKKNMSAHAACFIPQLPGFRMRIADRSDSYRRTSW